MRLSGELGGVRLAVTLVGNYDSFDDVNGITDESVADVNVWPSTNSTCGFTPTAPGCLLGQPQCPTTIFTAGHISHFTMSYFLHLRMQYFAFLVGNVISV